MNLGEFVPESDINAIEGCIADLAAKRDRPQGYPFSKINIYSVCPEIKYFMHLIPDANYIPAENVPSMRKLDFKKAGKVFGEKVKEMKNDLSSVPEEYIIIASRFDSINEPTRKTTGCRKFLIEIENNDCDEKWIVIKFRKHIKKYVTEDLNINIVPPIFGDKYPDLNREVTPRVWCDLFDCSEKLYQALEIYGKREFASLPIRLNIPTRKEIYSGIDMSNMIAFNDNEFGNIKFRIRT